MPRLCVVGGGQWGQNHIRTLHGLDMLGGIVEVDAKRLEHFAELYPNAAQFPTLDEALKAEFDGFTVATPAHTHFDLAARILRAGFSAMVEKPLALNANEAIALKDIADTAGQQLMVGHLMLFHPAIVKIKALIDNGKIGRVQYIYSNRINLGKVRTEENILWSFAPHDISIFQYLLGTTPIEVSSHGAAFLQPGVHDTTMTTLRYPGNIMCHNYVSWLHPFKEHRLVIIGSKGMLRFDDSSEDKTLVFYEKGIDWIDGEPIKRDGPTEQIAYGNGVPLTEELRYFAENLDGTIARADAKNAIEVLEILERATTSLQKENNDSAQKTSGATSAAPRQNIAPSATLGTNVKVHDSAYVDDDVVIGDGTKIWHYSHVQSGTTIGRNCSLGQNINVGNGVTIGNRVLIQNNVSVYHGVELEDYVFCGPSMTFTNVLDPRAKYPQGSSAYSKTLVKEGTSIGANATIVCGNTIGRHVFVAAGAVVTKDVPDYGFMIGVPARRQGWVTEGGERVPDDHVGIYECSKSGCRYEISNGVLTDVS